MDEIQCQYQYDGQNHPFVLNAHITNNITPKIEYSLTGKDGSWSTIKISVSDPDTTMPVFYRVTGYNTPTLQGVGTLRIIPAQVCTVTFVYLRNDGTEARYRTSVEYGESAAAPKLPELDAYVFDGWDESFDTVYSDLVVTARYSRRTVSCNVYSSLSNSYETITCFYGDALQPVAVCDQDPPDRWSYRYWYTYDKNQVVMVNKSEIDSFKQDGLDLYPYYRRLYKLTTYAMSDDTESKTFVSTIDVLSGESV